ncbi:type III secretion system (T3SS) inner membrane Yop/YscD-like protein [Archangium gephyra]|uniref:Adenylate cyclase n=1 Tax=Archangium gephyra TaxID=48 RepID=A0AAC8Q4W7_9BACT|nr:FHA domain-containing protein [Archangium gephyra]AKJ01034.1 Adenylate cyclase [Archangium gephyra]REG26197.1 type III secretion system (T3SS) inner membrane Yop/YscD-like protein [Archangium gephyra]
MSFQLTIAEGKEAGKEFEFEQDSVLIGRVNECDVVLYDAGISRRHCRIFVEGGQHFVEDLGSSNGTQVNGKLVKEKQLLAEGDQLSLGPVVFVFRPVAADIVTDAGGVNPDSTRIVSVENVARQRNRGAALAPEGANEEELEEARLNTTRPIQALRTSTRPGTQPALPPGGASPRTSTRPNAPAAGPGALSRAPASAPAAAPRRPTSNAVARSAPAAQGGGLSAAERARIRRESPGLVAQARLFWADASLLVRNAIIALGVLSALGLVGVVYWLVLGGETKVTRGPEPTVLGSTPIDDSFGLGEGVMWENADQKIFEWEYTAATRALAIVHFQAHGISEGEVVVTINGVDLGKVPPDTLASQDRVLEIMIPSAQLKKGEVNRITFDNTKNPPGEDEWRIWNLWLEKVLLPEIPPEQLVEEARKAYTRGRKNMENKEVGARNRYEAWKSFREAWLLLEAHPEPKPDLYYESRERVKDTQTELDRVCAKLMLEVEGYVNQNNWQAASATLDHTREYFPGEYDQRCARMAEIRRADLGL